MVLCRTPQEFYSIYYKQRLRCQLLYIQQNRRYDKKQQRLKYPRMTYRFEKIILFHCMNYK